MTLSVTQHTHFINKRAGCVFVCKCVCVCVCVSQVGLTCRPLCNDEKCGKGKHTNLAARHAGASVARSRRVIPHGGWRGSDRRRWRCVCVCVSVCAGLQPAAVLVLGGSRSSCGSLLSPAPSPRPDVTARPVKAAAVLLEEERRSDTHRHQTHSSQLQTILHTFFSLCVF